MDVWDGHSIFKTDNTKQLLSSTGNSAQCGSLDGTEIWGRMDTCICMAEFLRSSPETITRLLIGYTPKQNKKVRKMATDRLRGKKNMIKGKGQIESSINMSWNLALKLHKIFT